ncbi:MAG: HlyD family efflux transporter periplasmic adaptor subunit, partial [Phycisphaeraceae bacterium]
MNHIKRYLCIASLLLFTLTVVACGSGEQSDRHASEDADAHDNGQASANPNLIDIPSAVRTNLGISFVKVERRRVAQTLRVPGRFEYLPSARQAYRTPMPGRVELEVEQLEYVVVGSLLYRIDSPGLRSLQQQLAETVSEMRLLKVKVETFPQLIEAHEKHEASLQKTIDAWLRRVEQLEKLNAVGGGRQNELTLARATLTSSEAERATLLEKDAEFEAQRRKTIAEIKAVESRREYLLDAVSAVTSLTKPDLIAMVDTDRGQSPRWSTINRIEIRSDVAGVVSRLGLTNGSWADEKSPVLTVVQPDRLRFCASGLQSDLGVLKDGLPARIVAPAPTATGRAISIGEAMAGQLILGLEAD